MKLCARNADVDRICSEHEKLKAENLTIVNKLEAKPYEMGEKLLRDMTAVVESFKASNAADLKN